MSITTHHGDNLDILPTLRPASVQALISSPPFYGLRSYAIPPSAWPAVSYAPMPGLPPLDIPAMTCQLGAEPTPEAYTAHIVHTMRLARGALRGDGTVMLNFGDSYYSGGGSQNAPGGIVGQPGMRQGNAVRPPKLAVFDSKNLLLIPARVALALQADGWVLRNDAIWYKPNCMPESVKDRFTRSHEYCFVFSKSPRYFWDDAGEPIAQSSITRMAQPTFDDQQGGPKDYQNGTNANRSARKALENFRESGSGSRNRRTVLTIPTVATTLAGRCPACRGVGYDNRAAAADPAVARAPSRELIRELRDRYPCPACGATGRAGEEHYAMWPPALVEIFVRAMSSHRACEVCGAAWRRVVEREVDNSDYPHGPGGRKARDPMGNGASNKSTLATVAGYRASTTGHAPTCDCLATGAARCIILDPYAGSGTTGAVAERLGRDSVLIDLGYEGAREKRTDGVQVEMEAFQ